MLFLGLGGNLSSITLDIPARLVRGLDNLDSYDVPDILDLGLARLERGLPNLWSYGGGGGGFMRLVRGLELLESPPLPTLDRGLE